MIIAVTEMSEGVALVFGIALLALARWMWIRREQYRHGGFFFFDPFKVGQSVPLKWPRFHWYWNIWGSLIVVFVCGVLLSVGGVLGMIRWAI